MSNYQMEDQNSGSDPTILYFLKTAAYVDLLFFQMSKAALMTLYKVF